MKRFHIFGSARYKIFALGMILMAVLACAATLIIYLYISNIAYVTVEEENMNSAQQMQRTNDVIFRQSVITNSYSFLDTTVQVFMDEADIEKIDEEILFKLRDVVSQYGYTQRYIYEIGFYSMQTDYLCAVSGLQMSSHSPASKYEDGSVCEFISTLEPYANAYYFHFYRERYPYVMTLVKVNHKGTGATFLSVNMMEMQNYVPQEEFTDFYIIAKDGTVVLSHDRNEMGVNCSEIPKLSAWKPNEQKLRNRIGGEDQLIASVKSEYYDWYYVAVRETSDIRIPISGIQIIYAMVTVCLVFGFVYSAVLSKKTVQPLEEVMDMLNDKAILATHYSNEETQLIAYKLAGVLSSNKDLQNALEERMQEFHALQNTALQYQINPHFLYNTLNLVSMIAANEFGPRHEVISMISKLSSILRYSLDVDTNLVTLNEEMEYVHLYIDILKRRHRGIFEVQYDIPESIENAQVLRLSLQPLIENAVYHGIQPKGGGTLTIGATVKEHTLAVWVGDDGMGMSMDKVMELNERIHEKRFHSNHIGLANLHKRIQLLFGDEYGVEITSEEGCNAVVSMKLPFLQKIDYHENSE